MPLNILRAGSLVFDISLYIAINSPVDLSLVRPTIDRVTRFVYLHIVVFSVLFPARRYASAGLFDSDVSGPSVRPSVCLDVRHTPVLCLVERKQDSEM